MDYEQDTYYAFNNLCRAWIATSGIMNLVKDNDCYWVLDAIASYTSSSEVKNADYFKVVKVTINKDRPGCVFTIEHEVDGENIEIIRQDIEYTDLKDDLKLWAISEDNRTILLLPSEY